MSVVDLEQQSRIRRMDDAYGEFMGEFQPFLQQEILRLKDKYDLPVSSVLTVTGRGLIELGAVDLVGGLGGQTIFTRQNKDKIMGFSKKILSLVLLTTRAFIESEGGEIQ